MFQSKKQYRMGALGEKLARPGIALAVMLTLFFGLGARHDAKAGDDGSRKTLSGTWKTIVTITNCATGAPLPIPNGTFPGLSTYERNGSMVETGARSHLRSPGHGTWERTGPDEFLKRHMFFRFAADDTYLGPQEITRTIHLTSPDTSTAEGTVRILDTSGNVIATACDRETAVRF